MTESPKAGGVNGLATVLVPVNDQDAAIAFYRDRLGFELRSDTPMGRGQRWVEVAPPGSPTTVSLHTPQDGQPTGIDTHLAIGSGDVDGDHAALLAAGVDVDAQIMRVGDPVPPMFFFRDLDGNSLLLVQRP